MRLRPFLTSAALVTGLLATSAHSSAAWAQKAAVLSPVTPWALTKVDDADGKGGAYCAMARRFGHNAILTFARNEGAEASLALDFQSPKLATGENMKVILDPGAGEQRSYYINPISEQAFVVRLGRDDKFFSALATTGLLRIEAAGQSYSFNLSDIDAGQSRLVSCLTSGLPDDSPQQASADGGGGDIHQELESLRRDVQSLKKENGRLSSLSERTGNDDFDASIKEDLTSQADSLEQENQQLRGPTGLSAGQEPEPPAVNHLTQENHRLQNELAALSLGGQGAVAVHEKISTLEQQNMALKTDLSKGPDTQEWKRSKADLFALREENKRLQDLLAEKSGGGALVENLENQVQTLQSENRNLIHTAMDDTAQRMQAIAPAAGNEPAPMEGAAPESAPPAATAPPVAVAPTPPPEALVPAAPVAEDPQKKIEGLMAQLRDKDAKLVEMSNLTTERDALKTKNADLEQKLLDSAKDKDTIVALNEKIRKLEEENAALKKHGGGGSPDKVAALTKENTALKKQIEDLKAGAPAAQASADGATCTAAVAKAKEEADVAGQAEMQGLAKENMMLKEKIAKLTGAPMPKQEASAPDESPMTPPPEEKEAAAAPPSDSDSGQPAPVQEVIVSAPPEVQGATEAQMQEAEMMHAMDKPPEASPPGKTSDAINWNQAESPINAPPPMAPIVEVPVPAPEPAAGAAFSIKDVLISAQIAAPDQIQKVEKASINGHTAYQWRSGAVFGSAEQRPMTDPSQFDSEVSQYLDKTKKRCPGDFASSPDDSMQNGPDRIASYEIACVAKSINSSASLLFIDKAGTFTVVAHETSADKMDDAMSLRDKVMKTLTGQQ